MKKQILCIASILLSLGVSCQEPASVEKQINELGKKEINFQIYSEAIQILEHSLEDLPPDAPDTPLDKSELNAESLSKILAYERELLQNWIPLPSYVQLVENAKFENSNVRCHTLDTSNAEAPRTPAPSIEKQRTNFFAKFNTIRIPIHWHLLNNDNGYMLLDQQIEVSVSNRQLNNQMDIVNNTFNPDGIFFESASVNMVRHDDWNLYGDELIYDMTDSLTLNPETHLNVYVINGGATSEYYGQTIFPWNDFAGKYMDGIIINARTIPGVWSDSTYLAREGKTLIHEIGHYLGLYHTHHGQNNDDCENDKNEGCYFGDRVADTPAQKTCDFDGCDPSTPIKDTCPSHPGYDLKNNFMGFNPDSCMTEFTPGQITRIYLAVNFFRPHYLVPDF